MAKDKNATDTIEPTPDSADAVQPENFAADIDTLAAQHDALMNEVLVLSEKVTALESENAALRVQIELLSAKTAEVASSVSINPPAPPAPEKPQFDVEGQRYQFKVGEVRIGRNVVKATAIAADETLLAEVFGKYPGLFKKV